MKNLKSLIRVFLVVAGVSSFIFIVVEAVKRVYILPESSIGLGLNILYAIFIAGTILILRGGINRIAKKSQLLAFCMSLIASIAVFIVWVSLLTFCTGFSILYYFVAVKYSVVISWLISGVTGFLLSCYWGINCALSENTSDTLSSSHQ